MGQDGHALSSTCLASYATRPCHINPCGKEYDATSLAQGGQSERGVQMQTDPRLTTDDYIREAHALRAAAIARMFAALARMMFRRKRHAQASFG